MTMENYRVFKREIKEIKWFKNGRKYEFMMRLRSNTRDLGWREKENSNKICKLCKEEEETLIHFVLVCHVLQEIRNQCIELQRPRIEEAEEILRKMLLFKESKKEYEDFYINILNRMYLARDKILKAIE